MHLPPLIQDLALILVVAGATAMLFRWLKQPTVLGFLVAGVLVGPNVTLFPTVLDRANVQTWGELGVVFLLFVLGFEFSFKKLLQVGRVAFVAASFEVVLMTLCGWGLGQILGWSFIDSIFLGGMIAISSTMIVVKAFQELGVRTQHFSALVLGILVIEDLYAVALLAFLSTVALAQQGLQGTELLKQLGVLVGFLGITTTLGMWLVPRLLRVLRPYLNDELRVIVSLALCLSMVYASTAAGLSPALGAFLMGALMGDTSEGERIERFLTPIRDLFAAVFFTSVGMLLDVNLVINNPGLVLLISAVTMGSKILFATGGLMLAGQERRVSLQAGLSLAQIGEFSFIIGMLGINLGIIRSDLYAMAVAVSLLTTFTTPFRVRLAMGLHEAKLGMKRSRKKVQPRLWDGHLVELEIHPNSKFAGATLAEIKLRENFGAMIMLVHRGDRKIIAPGRDERLMPFDHITLFGTDEQLAKLESHLRVERHPLAESAETTYDLVQIHMANNGDSVFVGKTLQASGLRQQIDGMVLGIERQKARLLNPDSNTIIQHDDTLWVYGRRDLIRDAFKHFEKP